MKTEVDFTTDLKRYIDDKIDEAINGLKVETRRIECIVAEHIKYSLITSISNTLIADTSQPAMDCMKEATRVYNAMVGLPDDD